MTFDTRETAASIRPIRRVARNSAAASENTIHDDAVARAFGFRGALVPGVTLYAYLTQLVVPFFGARWLARGAATVRLRRPVYEGDVVICSGAAVEQDGATRLELACTGEDGTAFASGAAWMPADDPPDAGDGPLPDHDPPQPRPELTPDTVPFGVPLATLDGLLSPDDAAAYADETDDPSPWYRGPSPLGPRLVPPGALASRQAWLLRRNFHFGPSIHAASEVRHLAPAPVGAVYRTGGVIRETFERKGNHYLVLDALTTADGVPVVRVRHTSVFKVRGS